MRGTDIKSNIAQGVRVEIKSLSNKGNRTHNISLSAIMFDCRSLSKSIGRLKLDWIQLVVRSVGFELSVFFVINAGHKLCSDDQFDQVSSIISHECWREIRISGEIIKGCRRNLTFSPVRTLQVPRKILPVVCAKTDCGAAPCVW